MARIDVLMPQMGESIAEGTLSKWLKKLGDRVKRDEPIFEISTDKVDAEIPAPVAGVLAEILVQEGQTVPVQTLVARLETEAGAAGTAPAPAAAPLAPAKPAAAPMAPTPIAKAEAAPVGDETMEERLRRKSTPVVRKMVAEHGLDLTVIPGSGLAGRVTKTDVLTYLESGVAAAAAAPAPTSPPPPQPPRPPTRPSARPPPVPSSSPGRATRSSLGRGFESSPPTT